MKTLAFGLTVTLAMWLGATSAAEAQRRYGGHATEGAATLSLNLGYGFRVTDEGNLDDDANPYGTTLGARGGYTLDGGLYLGGLFNYFWGEEVGDEDTGGHLNQASVAADVGYDIGVGDNIVLRPLAGIGVTILSGEVCVLGQCADDQSDPYWLVAPGVDLLVSLGEIFVGGEARYLWLPDDEIPDGFMLTASIGAILR